MPASAPVSTARSIASQQGIGMALAAAALAAFAALSLWHGGRAAWSDAQSAQTRWQVSQWRSGAGPAASAAQWLEARDTLQGALQTAPDNAQLLDDLGFLHASRAQSLGAPAPDSAAHALQQELLASAIANYRAASALRPTFPYTWAYLALAKQLRGELDAELWLAFDKALRYGRTEPGVRPALTQLALANWAALGAERQTRFKAMLANDSKAVKR